jgi:hypothetical protein
VNHRHADKKEGNGAAHVVAVDMGYGHLRAAYPVAALLRTRVLDADCAPLCTDTREQRLWRWVRTAHGGVSRLSNTPAGLGDFWRRTMDTATLIEPLYGDADLARANAATLSQDWLIDRGLGSGLIDFLKTDPRPLFTTYYTPALVADRARIAPVYCLVTDADIHRIWVPRDSARSHIHYFAPSHRAKTRLIRYGVDPARITLTGFPLPMELVGGDDLSIARANLARRIARLDRGHELRDLQGYELERVLGPWPKDAEDEPTHITFAIGGAGAQAELADAFLPSLREGLRDGRFEITLVAGTRSEVATQLEGSIERAGLGNERGRSVSVLYAENFPRYYHAFNARLAKTDILWSKPSEISFYAALGLPLVLSKPLGSHERYNRRFLRELGIGFKQQAPEHAAEWLTESLHDGMLAGAAFAGFMRLPKLGAQRIADTILCREREPMKGNGIEHLRTRP